MSVAAAAPSSRYRAVPLRTLRVDSHPDFSLYLQNADETAERRHVLFCHPDVQFTLEHSERLQGNRVEHLFVEESEFDRYARYVERHLADVLDDPDLATRLKCELLHEVSREILASAFGDETASDVVKRAKNLSDHLVRCVLRDHEALSTLVDVLGEKDDLRTHSVTVCVYSLALARESGIRGPKELRELGAGALFHDIGKTMVPTEILAKPGSLTADEERLARRHVEFGVSAIRQREADTPWELLRPVLFHHEALDGTGYPWGLYADQITPDGRITAIVNRFGSLTSARPYRKAVTPFQALSRMKGEDASRYDQELLMTFIKLLARLSGH